VKFDAVSEQVYYRESRTMEQISIDYACSKSSINHSVSRIEKTLSAHGDFQLPGKQALQEAVLQSGDVKTVAMNVRSTGSMRKLLWTFTSVFGTIPHAQEMVSPYHHSVNPLGIRRLRSAENDRHEQSAWGDRLSRRQRNWTNSVFDQF